MSMSALQRGLVSVEGTPLLCSLSLAARRYRDFGTSGRVQGIGSSSHDNDPEVLQAEKQKHLAGKSSTTLKGIKGWSERLSSDSEAAIKAEKHHGESTVEEMQEHTIKTVKVLHDGEQDENEEQPKNVPDRAKR